MQSLGQIRSNVVNKVMRPGITIRFFSYFTRGIPFKAKSKVVVVKLTEWKLMLIIARNAKSNGPAKVLSDLGQKWQKTDYFQ